MSRTRKESNVSNPAKVKFEWVGHEEGGFFKVWDGENTHEITLPIRFAYLDVRKSVAGFYEKVQRGFYSNEVKYTKHEEFDVRYSKDGSQHPVMKGLWNEIKGDIGSMGAKFCNVVYATVLDDCGVVKAGTIIKLPMIGAAGSEWIDLKIEDGDSFEVSGFDDRKKGRTNYRAPLLRKIEISDEDGVIADECDGVLQEFFDSKKAVVKTTPEETPDATPTDDEDLVPF